MRSLFRSLLALFALGAASAGCNKSADSATPADRPRGTAAGQSEVTLYVPGMT
jgi:hypothetical protein